MPRTSASLLALLLVACASQDAGVWPDPVVQQVDHAWVWQGFRHVWSYNHRWDRIGGGVFVDGPARPRGSMPPEVGDGDPPGWSYLATAAAGTGRDVGQHEAHVVRVDAPDVRFVAVTQRLEVRAAEGRRAHVSKRVQVPLADALADLPVRGALLEGFWLDAGRGEAKQPRAFSLRVGEVVRTHDGVSVDLDVALEMDCDTPECLGCTVRPSASPWGDRVDYVLYTSLLLVLGEAEEVTFARVAGPEVSEAWAGPPRTGDGACLAPSALHLGCLDYDLTCGDRRLDRFAALDGSAGRTAVPIPETPLPRSFVGLLGVDLELDASHHMVELELATRPGAEDGVYDEVVRFQNWRHGMNRSGREEDVRASTAFGTRGAFRGRLDLAVVGLREGSTAEHTETTTLVSADRTASRLPLDRGDGADSATPLEDW